MSSEDLQSTVRALAERLGVLEAKEAIRVLTAKYNKAFDDMDVEGYAATFTVDGEFVLDEEAPIQGREAIKAFQREIGFGKVHATVDHLIEVNGNTARQVCNLLLGSRTENRAVGSAQIDNSGRYYDELVLTEDEGWLFAKRTWIPDAHLSA